jgi:hypothetical protein
MRRKRQVCLAWHGHKKIINPLDDVLALAALFLEIAARKPAMFGFSVSDFPSV